MKIFELIEELNKFDPNYEVIGCCEEYARSIILKQAKGVRGEEEFLMPVVHLILDKNVKIAMTENEDSEIVFLILEPVEH